MLIRVGFLGRLGGIGSVAGTVITVITNWITGGGDTIVDGAGNNIVF